MTFKIGVMLDPVLAVYFTKKFKKLNSKLLQTVNFQTQISF